MIRIRNLSHPSRTQNRRGDHSQKTLVRVYTGDVVTSSTPVTLDAVLGSCVAVCLFDPVLAIGGMNHIQLPAYSSDGRSTRYGVHAMELLINELMKLGGDRRRFVAKAFGGANVLPVLRSNPVGDENALFVRDYLGREGISLIAERLGGNHALQVRFKTCTGKAMVRAVPGALVSKIVHAESAYRRRHSDKPCCSEDVTLF